MQETMREMIVARLIAVEMKRCEQSKSSWGSFEEKIREQEEGADDLEIFRVMKICWKKFVH